MSADLAREIADGLRSLAQMIQDNPRLAQTLNVYALQHMKVPVGYRADMSAAEELAAFARAGKAIGATVEKVYTEDYGKVVLSFGGSVGIDVYAERAEVCERVVTGTEVVRKTVPDPAIVVPTVEVEETVELVEWRCVPLLAGDR